MKKVIIFIVILNIIGCNLKPDNGTSYQNVTIGFNKDESINISILHKLDPMKLYDSPAFHKVREIKDIHTFIKQYLEYRPVASDTWATPKEVLERKWGNCAELSILYMNILFLKFGIKTNFVLVLVDTRKIVEGGKADHAIIELGNKTFEPLTNSFIEYPIKYKYSFDGVFNQ